jgi:hypothetical protein
MTETFKTCPHLEPLERELAAKAVALRDGMTSPYGAQWGIWFPCDCTFDGPALRARLHLPDFITFEEYDGRVTGSDATFYCPKCNRAIMGLIPHYAPPGTPRVA